jgi:hypothetical protein
MLSAAGLWDMDCRCGQGKKSRRFDGDHQSTLVAVGTGRHVRVRSFTSILACPGYVRLRGNRGNWIGELAQQQGAWANIPPKRNLKDPICFSPYLYRACNVTERFFNKIKQCRRVATRYDKLAVNYLRVRQTRINPNLVTR